MCCLMRRQKCNTMQHVEVSATMKNRHILTAQKGSGPTIKITSNGRKLRKTMVNITITTKIKDSSNNVNTTMKDKRPTLIGKTRSNSTQSITRNQKTSTMNITESDNSNKKTLEKSL